MGRGTRSRAGFCAACLPQRAPRRAAVRARTRALEQRGSAGLGAGARTAAPRFATACYEEAGAPFEACRAAVSWRGRLRSLIGLQNAAG